jgi:hypothetical protein
VALSSRFCDRSITFGDVDSHHAVNAGTATTTLISFCCRESRIEVNRLELSPVDDAVIPCHAWIIQHSVPFLVACAGRDRSQEVSGSPNT